MSVKLTLHTLHLVETWVSSGALAAEVPEVLSEASFAACIQKYCLEIYISIRLYYILPILKKIQGCIWFQVTNWKAECIWEIKIWRWFQWTDKRLKFNFLQSLFFKALFPTKMNSHQKLILFEDEFPSKVHSSQWLVLFMVYHLLQRPCPCPHLNAG